MKKLIMLVILMTIVIMISMNDDENVIFLNSDYTTNLYGGCSSNNKDCLDYDSCYDIRTLETVEMFDCMNVEYPSFCYDGYCACYIWYFGWQCNNYGCNLF